MRARLLFHERRLFDDGAIMELKIWQVPEPVPPSTHRLKYSLFYGYPRRRLVAFDNERGKGDHRHVDEREQPYRFVTVERLMAAFLAAVAAARSGQ